MQVPLKLKLLGFISAKVFHAVNIVATFTGKPGKVRETISDQGKVRD
jgi:hypothetical protein